MVKWTTIASLIGTDTQILAVEQPTLQWQKNIYNNGSLFFYPDDASDADYLDFQQKTFFACFNQERPRGVSSHALSVSWDGCPGKLDLNVLEDAFFLEFKQMWESSLSFQDQLRGSNQLNLRYFLAGVGGALGHVIIADRDLDKINQARLQGILKFLKQTPNASIGKIKRLELPLSHYPDTPAIRGLLEQIKTACDDLQIVYGGTDLSESPITPRRGYVTAINTCSAAAVMPGATQPSVPGARPPLRTQIARALPLGGCHVLNNPHMKETYSDPLTCPTVMPEAGAFGMRR